MARKSAHIDVPLELAWEALADGWRYSDWVVGSRHVRDVDADWPALGTKIHHTVGIGPVSWNDETEVVEVEEPHRLLLEARLRPFGTARVQLELAGLRGGTHLTMDERPARGPLARPHNSASELLQKARNVESLRRFKRVAESRARASGRSRRRSGEGQDQQVGAKP